MFFSEKRFQLLGLVPVIVFTIIGIRLFYLQVVRGNFYVERSQSNFIQERPIHHSRGMIYDQSGKILVDNRPARDLYVTFAMLPNSERIIKQLADILGLKNSRTKKIIRNLRTSQQNNSESLQTVGFLKDTSQCLKLEALIQDEYITGAYVEQVNNSNDETCVLKINPQKLPSQKSSFKRLSELLGMSASELQPYVDNAQKKARGLRRFKPKLLMSDIPFEAYARIETAISLGLLPGIVIFDSVKRRYIHNSFASHLLGFMNETSPKELERSNKYKLGELIGRKGIERVYESELRGKNGVERYVVDAKGRRYSESWEQSLLGKGRIIPPQPGNGLVLALDKDMQKQAENSFPGKAGSVIAMEVGTGFILALASFPSFNPNEIMSRDNNEVLDLLNQSPHRPWVNKAIQENYAPGSTFKAITAIAGFENNVLAPETKHNCTGVFQVARTTWRCFERQGHGNIGVIQALKTSCDSYFYNVGQALGSEKLAETARLLGFGKKTGIDLELEIKGIIPDKQYYDKRFGYTAPGFVVNSSVGQGDVTVTPIQLLVAYDAILNGGTIFKPQIVRQVVDVNKKVLKTFEPHAVSHLKENKDTLDLVKEGLSHVMKPGGTARGLLWRADLPELAKWLRNSGVEIGGKTGTAQVVKLSKTIQHLDPKKVAYLRRDHAWFVGFAPAKNPEIVVVAMTEHGGYGGRASAPVVAELIKTWFEKVRGKGRYEHSGKTASGEG